MQLLQLLHHDFIDLQMTLFATTLLIHHPNEAAKPVGLLLLLFVGIVETVDILLANTAQRTVEGTDGVLNLPHIKQVFSNVFLS